MKKYLTFTSQAAITAVAAASLSLISVASAAEETKPETSPKKESSSLSAKDKMFLRHAYHGGLKEVAMGEMAQKEATSDDVKKVGEKIASDHKDANKEVMDLAEKKGLTLTGEAPKMKKYPGDKEYLMAMQKDHEKDIAA